jgi:nuclear transport factor 2 (NTF2) superfamily protein
LIPNGAMPVETGSAVTAMNFRNSTIEGSMQRRYASINYAPIEESERRLLTKNAKIA